MNCILIIGYELHKYIYLVQVEYAGLINFVVNCILIIGFELHKYICLTGRISRELFTSYFDLYKHWLDIKNRNLKKKTYFP